MITLTDSIEVNATPEQVFKWLVQRSADKESYQAWHPDHVDVRWIKGKPVEQGAVCCADEYIHGVLYRLKFRITKVVPNRRIEYRFLFPLSLLAPGNVFLIEPKDGGGCTFIAKGNLRISRWLFERMHRKHKGKIEATRQHMKEEGENLKKAVEAENAQHMDGAGAPKV